MVFHTNMTFRALLDLDLGNLIYSIVVRHLVMAAAGVDSGANLACNPFRTPRDKIKQQNGIENNNHRTPKPTSTQSMQYALKRHTPFA